MPERKPINPWLIFVLICVPIFIGSVDLTSIVVVLPQATLDLLGPKGLNKADQALWAVTAYLLAYTLSLALVGRLSDVLPRKRIFLACIVIFIFGSLWAGTATGLPLAFVKLFPIWPDPDVLPLISLVIGRIVQAIGAGASVSVGMAMVSDLFPPERRAEPISLIGALDSLGWVVGNLYAGLMLQVLPSWRWLFLINAGVAFVALVLAVIALRHSSLGTGSGRFDWRGALIFAAALIALVIGIQALQTPNLVTVLLIGGSLALFVLFGWLQLRTRGALFDMQFIRQPEVRAALITNMIVGFGLILMVAGVPLVINLRALFLRGEGLLTGALRAGITLCALTIPLIVAVLVGEGRYRRIGAAIPVALGLALAILGFIGASTWTYTAPSYVIALPLALVGVGLGLTIGPLSLVVIDAAEASARGLAASLVLMMRLLGMTFGTPIAASLTITLANVWASERVADMHAFQDIARAMLIPPMATDALARVMLIGVAVCAVGLIAFYLPRARQAIRKGLGPRAVLHGALALVTVILVIGGLSVIDSYTTPTILHNPIAQQLPPNVTFYAAINMQQVFLQNTRRPLDAVVNLLNAMAVPSGQPGQPGQPAAAPPASTPESTVPPPVSTPAATEPAAPPAAPAGNPPSDTTADNVMRSLFRVKKWTVQNDRAFCSDPTLTEQWQWENCFTSGLLSWIGPQAAFALLPRNRAADDYVFAFQATNRNNAILFATNLAVSLGEKEPEVFAPTVRVLSINSGTPDEQRIAITDAYVLIGTPQAIEYTLNHGDVSLADDSEFQAITAQLPPVDFATFFIRASSFETDLKPALDNLFRSPLVDTIFSLIGRVSPLAFARTNASPTLVGTSLRVDERQLMLDMVANLPFSLQKLNASPVPGELLGMIPGTATMWAVTDLNIAGLAREMNVKSALTMLADSGDRPDLKAMLDNPLIGNFVASLGQTFQNVLTYARGQLMIMTLPSPNVAQVSPDVALILPLVDKETTKAASAVDLLKNQLTLLGGLSGTLTIDTQPGSTGNIMTVHGKALAAVLPNGFQFTLTSNNLLILATNNNLGSFLDMLNRGRTDAALNEITASLSGPLDKFLYLYVDPSVPNADLTALVGAQIKRQGLYLNIVLRTREP